MTVKLINGDCIEEMRKLIDEGVKVDLILTDPPYGTVKGMDLNGWKNQTIEWDNRLPTKEMFDCCEKLLRMNGICILFSQEPYTSYLRQFKPQNLPFIYPFYWLKDHFANSLSSKKAPVNYVEDLSVFRKKYDIDNTHPLRIYAQKLLSELDMNYKDIEKVLGHRRAEHFFYRIGSSQFSLCTEETYNQLIEIFNIDKLPCFKSYDELEVINSKFKSKFKTNFNKTKGKYKSNVLEYGKLTENYFKGTMISVRLFKRDFLMHLYGEDSLLEPDRIPRYEIKFVEV